ncbi:MAG: hypothetical protein COW00_02925 [Bdellovibrio sp. CG12_big_fil_rev_8_21_14_0_65_39_13]|nr:MAG: hypothetical protein COW78_13455 [Bdellovibrio sp. CG22_combo_CG10-13_8_21_14_all_39_27]PIQ61736.1 MAG: hypothetical protein COW00_02925 [Bdellovibrio sp. CG12_big_fil_rev_8_21_14_0_65_39_13]PIR34884.1 MAG: hypothetical protein COV37_11525 [Bdellovibrio sp. CG11_big_fil_rev_8_21_14_0_20_39_38]
MIKYLFGFLAYISLNLNFVYACNSQELISLSSSINKELEPPFKVVLEKNSKGLVGTVIGYKSPLFKPQKGHIEKVMSKFGTKEGDGWVLSISCSKNFMQSPVNRMRICGEPIRRNSFGEFVRKESSQIKDDSQWMIEIQEPTKKNQSQIKLFRDFKEIKKQKILNEISWQIQGGKKGKGTLAKWGSNEHPQGIIAWYKDKADHFIELASDNLISEKSDKLLNLGQIGGLPQSNGGLNPNLPRKLPMPGRLNDIDFNLNHSINTNESLEIAKCLGKAGAITAMKEEVIGPEVIDHPYKENLLKLQVYELIERGEYDTLLKKIIAEKVELTSMSVASLIEKLPSAQIENILKFSQHKTHQNYLDSQSFYIPGENRKNEKNRILNEISNSCNNKETFIYSYPKLDIENPDMDYVILRSLYKSKDEYAKELLKKFESTITESKKIFQASFKKFSSQQVKMKELEKYLNQSSNLEDYIVCRVMLKEYPSYAGNEKLWPSNLDHEGCEKIKLSYESAVTQLSGLNRDIRKSYDKYQSSLSHYFSLLKVKNNTSGLPPLDEISSELKYHLKEFGELIIENKDDFNKAVDALFSSYEPSQFANLLAMTKKTQSNLLTSSLKQKEKQESARVNSLKKYLDVVNSVPIAEIELEGAKNGNKAFLGDFGRLFEKIGKKIEAEIRRVRDRIKNDGIFKELEHQFKGAIDLVGDWSVDIVEGTFCPKTKIGSGWCIETGDKGVSCKYSQAGDGSYSCEIIDRSGRGSGPGRQVKKMDWSAALAWLRKNEMQDFLKNMSSQMSLNLQRAMFNSPEQREQFQRILAYNQQDILDLTQNGTKIPEDPYERSILLERINSSNQILGFLEGVGNGSFNSIKDSTLGLIHFASNLQNTAAGISAIINMIYDQGFEQFGSALYATIGEHYNDFLQASPEGKGEIVGYAMTEVLTLIYGGAIGKTALEAIKVASAGTKGALLFEKIAVSSGKLGLKLKEEIVNFANFTERVWKNEVGGIGKVEGLIDSVQNGVVKLDKYSVNTPNKLDDLRKVVDTGPLSKTKYSPKVEEQMRLGDYHAFPKEVDNWAGVGKKSPLIGGDGITRTKIELSGGYNGKEGHFEWIIEADNVTVRHRLFVPKQ